MTVGGSVSLILSASLLAHASPVAGALQSDPALPVAKYLDCEGKPTEQKTSCWLQNPKAPPNAPFLPVSGWAGSQVGAGDCNIVRCLQAEFRWNAAETRKVLDPQFQPGDHFEQLTRRQFEDFGYGDYFYSEDSLSDAEVVAVKNEGPDVVVTLRFKKYVPGKSGGNESCILSIRPSSQ